jgi:hypothetical protein
MATTTKSTLGEYCLLGIVSKPVRKSVRCQVSAKQCDDRRLESFDGIEQNVKSVNLRSGSVRRSRLLTRTF